MDPQAAALDDGLQLIRGSLDAVDDAHHAEIALVAEADACAVVGRQRTRGRGDDRVGAGEGRDHELVTDQDPRCVCRHGRGEIAEDLDTVFVGPVVAKSKKRTQVREKRARLVGFWKDARKGLFGVGLVRVDHSTYRIERSQ